MYKDKMSVRGMVNMLTKFESTRIIHEEIEDDERFYAACDLLESQMDEQDPDEEIDLETKSLFEDIISHAVLLWIPCDDSWDLGRPQALPSNSENSTLLLKYISLNLLVVGG